MTTTVTSSQVSDWIDRLAASGVPNLDSYIVGLLIDRNPAVLADVLDRVEVHVAEQVKFSEMSSDEHNASFWRTNARISTSLDRLSHLTPATGGLRIRRRRPVMTQAHHHRPVSDRRRGRLPGPR